MRWSCARDCGAGGEKRYESAERAARFARAFDSEDRDGRGSATAALAAAARTGAAPAATTASTAVGPPTGAHAASPSSFSYTTQPSAGAIPARS